MIFSWILRKVASEGGVVIKTGEVEAKNVNEVWDELNEQGIAPHTGEILEIDEPKPMTKGLDDTILS